MKDSEHEQWLKDRYEAFLSMDKEKIIAYEKKYNIVHEEEFDEYIFWISVHKGRTAMLSLPEQARRLSMWWLIEHRFSHYASDLEEQGKCIVYK